MASRCRAWRIITGRVGSSSDMSASPARTAGSTAAVGSCTHAASPSKANGTRPFTVASISSRDLVGAGSVAS